MLKRMFLFLLFNSYKLYFLATVNMNYFIANIVKIILVEFNQNFSID